MKVCLNYVLVPTAATSQLFTSRVPSLPHHIPAQTHNREHPRLTNNITGITGDTIGRLLKFTALNPILTVPLLLAARYTAQGNVLASEHATTLKHLKTLVGLGVLNSLSAWLDNGVINNWKSDTYDWSKEVVVVTGGSDGIGKIVVQLLAEKGIKVAVLDVQELTYEGIFFSSFFPHSNPTSLQIGNPIKISQ